MPEKINICYATSDEYAEYTGISIYSLLKNTPKRIIGRFFILDYGIKKANRNRFHQLEQMYNIEFEYISAEKILVEIKERLGIASFRSSLATYSRAFIDQIIPDNVCRLLYIDSDTIVNRSIEELVGFNMGECAIAGAIALDQFDSCHATSEFPLMTKNKIYIGCGIVLYDLNNWRKLNCTKWVCDICNSGIKTPFADQTLINNAIPEKYIKVLPIKYNYAAHGIPKDMEMKHLQSNNWYTAAECKEAVESPVIIHYKGWAVIRPWYDECVSRRTTDYRKYKAESPWRDIPLSVMSEYLKTVPIKQAKENRYYKRRMEAKNVICRKIISLIRRIDLSVLSKKGS